MSNRAKAFPKPQDIAYVRLAVDTPRIVKSLIPAVALTPEEEARLVARFIEERGVKVCRPRRAKKAEPKPEDSRS